MLKNLSEREAWLIVVLAALLGGHAVGAVALVRSLIGGS